MFPNSLLNKMERTELCRNYRMGDLGWVWGGPGNTARREDVLNQYPWLDSFQFL